MLAGIDFGNKKAGTTAICIGDRRGDIKLIASSEKGKDADWFLREMVGKDEIDKLFIDAPLSLPGVYRNPDKYSDYFYRRCDRDIGAMSPMFLGGLTARAVKLKDIFEKEGLEVFEVWPTKMAEIIGIPGESYKIGSFSSSESILKTSEYLKNDFSVSSWHEFDAVLAYISGLRIIGGGAKKYGEKWEGLIYV